MVRLADPRSPETGNGLRVRVEAVVLAFALHAALSLEPIGISRNVAVANLVLPYFAALAIWTIFFRKRVEIAIGWRCAILFFLAVAVLMAIGLLVGAQFTGAVTSFGIRRTVSMALMAGYFLAGVYIASCGERVRDLFVFSFVAAAVAISAAACIAYLMTTVGIGVENPVLLTKLKFRFIGLMDNAIPFSWLILSAFAFQVAYQRKFHEKSPRLNIAGLSILIAVLLLVGAKAAWIGAAVFVAVFFIAVRQRPRVGPLLIAAVIGALLAWALAFVVPAVESPSFIVDQGKQDLHVTTSVDVRRQQLFLALELIRQHPFLGVGLGGYNWEAAIREPIPTHYLHNSLLWLWVELGPAAVIVFVAFFVRVMSALWSMRAAADEGIFPVAIFALLCSFAAISIVDDILFQRYLWVFVGAAVTVGYSRRSPVQGAGSP